MFMPPLRAVASSVSYVVGVAPNVTMSGVVKTQAEETRAVQLARNVNGVKDVKSTLQVNP